MAIFSDTICAPATTPGTGAVSMIRVSGAEAHGVADKVIRFRKGTASEAKGYSLKFGSVWDGDTLLDEVMVSIYRAPRSYTGEDSIEICCHASSYIVSRLLDMLCAAGCRLALPGEFTQRAFLSGKMDLAQAEAVADVIASSSSAAHRVAMNQLKGGYSAELASLRAELLDLNSLLELELDFSEEDVEFADRSRLSGLLEKAESHCRRLAESFRMGNAVRNGVPVAIVGAPNSGKSTLLNALLREDRAIVSDIPGTTRDTVEETCTIGGVLFRFIDTAGIRDASDVIEKLGVERSLKKLSEATHVLLVVDAGSPADAVTEMLKMVLEKLDLGYQKLTILVNKVDEFEDNKNVINNNKSVVSAYLKDVGFDDDASAVRMLEISAKTGLGLENVENRLASDVTDAVSSGTLVTNARHAAALRSAADSLSQVLSGIALDVPTDLLAEDLRDANDRLGEITGQISTDEVLGNIFKKFCIGK